MTSEEYDQQIARLGKVYRVILAEAAKGPVTAPSLRAPTGRADGMTVELRKLQGMGFLRETGRVNTGKNGIRPREYTLVRPHDVDEAREAWGKRTSKRKKRRSLASTIPELQAREPGNYDQFRRTRIQAIQLSVAAKQVGKVAFWDAAPRDDLARVANEFIEVIEALTFALEQLAIRADDDALVDKIEKMLAPDGRGAVELDTFREAAKKLSKRLLPLKRARRPAA